MDGLLSFVELLFDRPAGWSQREHWLLLAT